MNFIKKIVGEKKEKENCCGVEIKEVESKEVSCCDSEEERGCC
jgi:hypothetical protein